MFSEELLCLPSTAKPRLNALQELFVYYAARQDISVTGKTSQPSFEDILKARACEHSHHDLRVYDRKLIYQGM
jgi:hypothetical protein